MREQKSYRGFWVHGKKGLFVLCDGEINGNVTVPVYAMSCSKRSGQNVQRTADCIDVSPTLDAEGQRERLFFEQYQEVVLGILFYISNAGMQVGLEPSLQPLLKGWKIGFGPVYGGASIL